MIYLHKFLPLLFSPLFAVIFLVFLGLIFRSTRTSLAGLVILITCSLPIVSGKLASYLEQDYQLDQISSFEKADAIVVLSGMLRTVRSKNGLAYEFSEAADRIFTGIDLFKKKKAPYLILTRGHLPWSVGKPEGEHLREIAISLGISEQNILLTSNVENTDQEARAVRMLLTGDKPSILLVTSAFHMPRAHKVFEAAGIRVLPVAVDFQSGAENFSFMSLVPSAGALSQTSFFIREMIGRTYYSLKY